MDAVGALHLAVEQPVVEVFVVGVGAVGVFALDAAAAGRVVARGRQPDGRLVGEVELPLYQSLAEGAASHDDAAVVVLYRARDNLAGRGAEVVDQDDHLALLEVAAAGGVDHLRAHFGALDGDDFAVLGQELVAHADGRVEEAAGVGAQIDDQGGHALPLELQDGVVELLGRGAAELVELDVAGVGVHHIGHIHGVGRNHAARDLVGVLVLEPRTQDADLHLCALVAAQQLEGLLVLNADDGLPIHLDHTVAGHQPGFLGGTAGDDRHHHQRVVHNVELDADALERALQSLHRRLVVLGGGVGGVRIQSLQHRVDSQPVNRVHIDGIHVVLVDVSHHLAHLLELVVAALAQPVRVDAQGEGESGQEGDQNP